MAKPPEHDNVALFWGEDRVASLRETAADTTLPDDQFLRSRMAAWLREFAMSAPSWLEAETRRTELVGKLIAMQGQIATLGHQVEGMVHLLQASSAPPSSDKMQPRWFERLTNAPGELPRPAERPPVEVDPPDPDVAAADVVEPPAKPPAAAAKAVLEREQARVAAERKTDFGRALDKLSPTAEATLVGGVRPYDAATAQSRGAAGAKLQYDTGEEGYRVEPNPDELPPDAEQAIDHHKSDLAKRPAENAPATTGFGPLKRPTTLRAVGDDWAADNKKTIVTKAKRADGTPVRRSGRTGYKMKLKQVAHEHGQAVADYVVEAIGKGINTGKVQALMAKFEGTYPSRPLAATDAQHKCDPGKTSFDVGYDPLVEHASHVHEHDDGVSWWRK